MKPGVDDYPRTPLRRRVLVVVLGVATALTIMLSLIYRPGDPKRGLPRAAAPAPASAGSAAVGGKAEVLLLPAASAASR